MNEGPPKSAPSLSIRDRLQLVDPRTLGALAANASETLDHDQPLKRQLGEKRFTALNGYVIRLLRGETIPLQEITDHRLNPHLIKRKASNYLTTHQTRLNNLKHLERNLSRERVPSEETLRLQNPHYFDDPRIGELD